MVSRTKNVFSRSWAPPAAVLSLSIAWVVCVTACMPSARGAEGKTTKDGVYDQEQAERGKEQYAESLSEHGAERKLYGDET